MPTVEGDRLVERETPLWNAMNEVLRDDYVEDCERGVARWNRILERAGLPDRISLPHRRFHRRIGAYAGHRFDPAGRLVSEAEWERKKDEWLPTEADREYVRSLMVPATGSGEMAAWIAAPTRGVHGKPADFEYVRRA